MKTILHTYNVYKQSLSKTKLQLNSGKITMQEAQEQAVAQIINLNSLIASMEFVYPEYLIDKLRDLIDEYEIIRKGIVNNNQLQYEEKTL